MKTYLINMHLLVPRSRLSAKVKVKHKGYISQKNGHFGGIHVSQTHLVHTGIWSSRKCCEKWRKAGWLHFFPFKQCFQKRSLGRLKSGLCDKGLTFILPFCELTDDYCFS